MNRLSDAQVHYEDEYTSKHSQVIVRYMKLVDGSAVVPPQNGKVCGDR